MPLIEPGQRKILYTNFTDEIGAGNEIDLDAVSPGIDKARFTRKARRFVEKHKDHITLLKLRRAEQLTPTDLAELERMFVAEGLPMAEGAPEIASAGGLGLFLRSLTGLDRKAAKEAFSTLCEGRALPAAQIDFLDMAINHLTERGVIEPRLFYESPFTDLNAQGIDG